MSDSLIKRTKRDKNFSVIGNEVFNCVLKADTLGVLVYILHLPDDWILRKTQLCSRFNMGRDKMDRIFKELKAAGFIGDIVMVRGTSGKFDGVNYLVYDYPINRTTEKPLTDNHTTEKPLTENPWYGKSDSTKNYNTYKELIVQRTNIQSTNVLQSTNNIKVNQQKIIQNEPPIDELYFLDE